MFKEYSLGADLQGASVDGHNADHKVQEEGKNKPAGGGHLAVRGQ